MTAKRWSKMNFTTVSIEQPDVLGQVSPSVVRLGVPTRLFGDAAYCLLPQIEMKPDSGNVIFATIRNGSHSLGIVKDGLLVVEIDAEGLQLPFCDSTDQFCMISKRLMETLMTTSVPWSEAITTIWRQLEEEGVLGQLGSDNYWYEIFSEILIGDIHEDDYKLE